MRASLLHRLIVFGILVLANSSLVARAQEIEEKDEATETREEREIHDAIGDMLEGKRFILPTDELSRATHRSIFRAEHPNAPLVTFVEFHSSLTFARNIEISSNYAWGNFHVPSLDHSGVSNLYNNSDTFLLLGDYKLEDLRWFSESKLKFVIWDKFSPKTYYRDATNAIGLTSQVIRPSDVLLFDGLPLETDPARSAAEMTRMGLAQRPKEWRDARHEIRKAAAGFRVETATKQALLSELKNGSQNFMFVIAHSDSKSVYLPGEHGGRVSLDELKRIQRNDAPDRVIVLLSCKTADIQGGASIAQVILHNKLATTVMASRGYVYAADVASMISAFQAKGKLSEAFPGLVTLVDDEKTSEIDLINSAPPSTLAFTGGSNEPYR